MMLFRLILWSSLSIVTFLYIWGYVLDIWPLELSVQLGAVNATHAIVWTRCVAYNGDQSVHVVWRHLSSSVARSAMLAGNTSDLSEAEHVWSGLFASADRASEKRTLLRDWSDKHTSIAILTPLESQQCYVYKVEHPCVAHGTVCAQSTNSPLTMAFGSCMARTFPPFHQLRSFDFIRRDLQPNFVALLGDIVYPDTHQILTQMGLRISIPLAWRRTWSDPALEMLLRSTPSVLMHDDHEVENDWRLQGRTEPHSVDASVVEEALHWFYVMAGMRQPQRGYFSLKIGDDVSVFMLDTRSFRSSNGTMLGEAQWAAFEKWLYASANSRWRVILSPVMFGALPIHSGEKDQWAHYPQERERLLRIVRDTSVEGNGNVIFSGDVHYAGVFQYPEYSNLWEVTTSPFLAIPFPKPTEWRPEGTGGEYTRFFRAGYWFFGAAHWSANGAHSLRVEIWQCRWWSNCGHGGNGQIKAFDKVLTPCC